MACTKYWTVILLASTALPYYTYKTWDKTLLSLGNTHLNHIIVIHRFSLFFFFFFLVFPQRITIPCYEHQFIKTNQKRVVYKITTTWNFTEDVEEYQYKCCDKIAGVPEKTRPSETLNCSKSKTGKAKKLTLYQPVYLIS